MSTQAERDAWADMSWHLRPLTDEEVDRYRKIVVGRRHRREIRDWSDRDIAALLATLDECEGRVAQAQEAADADGPYNTSGGHSNWDLGR